MIFGSSWLGTAAGLMYSAIWKENNTDVIVSRIMTLLYVILVLPLTLVLLITLISKPFGNINKLNDNNNNDITESFFTWARYQFDIIVPVIILLFYKQVYKKSESIICWFKRNSIQNVPNRSNNNSLRNISMRKMFVVHNNPNKTTKVSIPVLFATSNGLHLRTLMENVNSELPSTSNENKNSSLIVCQPCDLTQTDVSLSISKASTIQPGNNINQISNNKKYVRFASPQISEIPLNESGIWSNNEEAEAFRINSINIQSQKSEQIESEHQIHGLGITYTKV